MPPEAPPLPEAPARPADPPPPPLAPPVPELPPLPGVPDPPLPVVVLPPEPVNPAEPPEPVDPDAPPDPVDPDPPPDPVVEPPDPVDPDEPPDPLGPAEPPEPVVPDEPPDPLGPDEPPEPVVPDEPPEPVRPVLEFALQAHAPTAPATRTIPSFVLPMIEANCREPAELPREVRVPADRPYKLLTAISSFRAFRQLPRPPRHGTSASSCCPMFLVQFARRYPEVSVSVRITNLHVDLVAEGFDLAIRVARRELKDSKLVARRLGDLGVVGKGTVSRAIAQLEAHLARSREQHVRQSSAQERLQARRPPEPYAYGVSGFARNI